MFFGVAAGLTVVDAGAQSPPSIPVIDTHIHLYDPSRPQGVPWPNEPPASRKPDGRWLICQPSQ